MAAKFQEKRNRQRLQLANGCSCTEPYVSPDNWASRKASVKVKWFVRFSFTDPIHRPGGMTIKWEKSLNNFHSLPKRQDEARKVLEQVLRDLKAGLNPAVGNTMLPSIVTEGQKQTALHEFISPSTTFAKVVEWCFGQFPDNRTKSDVQMVLLNPIFKRIFSGLSFF
jgi:hypothetical protein